MNFLTPFPLKTGLDPAGVGFENEKPMARLDPTDAKFVDVIHTDAREGPLGTSMGVRQPSGHVDFYPNDGKQQAGCDTLNVVTSKKENTII